MEELVEPMHWCPSTLWKLTTIVHNLTCTSTETNPGRRNESVRFLIPNFKGCCMVFTHGEFLFPECKPHDVQSWKGQFKLSNLSAKQHLASQMLHNRSFERFALLSCASWIDKWPVLKALRWHVWMWSSMHSVLQSAHSFERFTSVSNLDICVCLSDAGSELTETISLKSCKLMCVIFDPQLANFFSNGSNFQHTLLIFVCLIHRCKPCRD